ncbi:MAG: hypothetical protein U5N27_00940 [Rhizobium sp.]|nr:hypothetical protein [Rhizobium sp.]
MDFMRLLKSLEELLYELVSWLVFYPMTFWRAFTRPLSMMRYADDELGDRPEDQYDDTISPPLFLLITLLLSRALSTAFPSVASPTEVTALTHSPSNLLIVRGVIFRDLSDGHGRDADAAQRADPDAIDAPGRPSSASVMWRRPSSS